MCNAAIGNVMKTHNTSITMDSPTDKHLHLTNSRTEIVVLFPSLSCLISVTPPSHSVSESFIHILHSSQFPPSHTTCQIHLHVSNSKFTHTLVVQFTTLKVQGARLSIWVAFTLKVQGTRFRGGRKERYWICTYLDRQQLSTNTSRSNWPLLAWINTHQNTQIDNMHIFCM